MSTTAPTPVEGYVAACNTVNGDTPTALCADEAFVNDARPEFWRNGAIRRRLDRELVGDKVTMRVTATAEHYREVVVHAAMDGDYNESGLPNPLVPTHDFTMRDDRIVRVVIIRNEHTEAS